MAKLNGATKWISIAMAFLVLFASIIASYTYLQAKTTDLSDDIAEIKPKCEQNEKDVIGMKKDLEYIKKGIDEIKAEVKKP